MVARRRPAHPQSRASVFAARRVIRELFADARNAVGATALVADIDWPPRAVTMRVLDLDGREFHSRVKGDTQS